MPFELSKGKNDLILSLAAVNGNKCMHACMHAFMHASVHAFMHAFMHAFVHALMHVEVSPREFPHLEENDLNGLARRPRKLFPAAAAAAAAADCLGWRQRAVAAAGGACGVLTRRGN